MISLTRLNHQSLILNSDLIKTIEQPHDTVVTLITGEKLMVMESPAEIVQRVEDYRGEHPQTSLERALPLLTPKPRGRYGSK